MAPKLFFEGNYVRTSVMKIPRNLSCCLYHFNYWRREKRLLAKYEKIPFFCKHCGLLGHDHEECGDGAWEEKYLQYGAWMLAKRMETHLCQLLLRKLGHVEFQGRI
jgi:hypothetical protein